MSDTTNLPPRFRAPSALSWVVLVGFAAFFIQGIIASDISVERLVKGASNLVRFVGQAIPPDFSRMPNLADAMLETMNIAVVGVTFGCLFSVPLALLAARNTAPNGAVRAFARFVISVARTIPDLIWALIFVVTVGLGPLAGILAIVMDTIGFAARFYSERFEEVQKGPSEALTATGAGRLSVIFGAILPESFASTTATSLFSVEKAIRSAVTLGLVGAGGIGVELSTAMRLFRYDQAAAIIIVILVVVVGFEQLSTSIRKRII
ncbi:phosphonate ABC transporter, permease protein PhnE [Loktanella sp. SALINAS62]|uniref:phosphonate ABC transporter, permease protein PhnE n=1 Tax=Loktanella sp. SALINAS62 TaxID=2706124 RepID=UPI001B8D88A1|nr:phosphonate ABC transporter, permease protein PhnE [Loktanella sp. SALINAS62]MBS1300924.1 phosphonate ABC transporter, permease protein PhnE [Loktanella sp. SALINAS62]